jgi:hypothetical protein
MPRSLAFTMIYTYLLAAPYTCYAAAIQRKTHPILSMQQQNTAWSVIQSEGMSLEAIVGLVAVAVAVPCTVTFCLGSSFDAPHHNHHLTKRVITLRLTYSTSE